MPVMKKTTIAIVIVALIVLAAGAVWYFKMNGARDKAADIATPTSTPALATTTTGDSIGGSPMYQLPDEKYRVLTIAGSTYRLDLLKSGDRVGLWTVSEIRPKDPNTYDGVPSGINLVAKFNGTTTLRGILSQKGGVHSLEMTLDADSSKKLPVIPADYQSDNVIFFMGNDDELISKSNGFADIGQKVDVVISDLIILRTETDASGIFSNLIEIKKP